jgi:hypothetical protein
MHPWMIFEEHEQISEEEDFEDERDEAWSQSDV